MFKKFINLLVLSLCLVSTVARGDESAWDAKTYKSVLSKTYKYLLIDQDLRDALNEFGHNIDVPIRITETVGRRRIQGPLHFGAQATAHEFLEKICDNYGLVWYFDGSILHIASVDDMDTELIKIENRKPADVLSSLEKLGLTDARFTLRINEDSKMLSISGPPAYREIVKKAVLAGNNNSNLRVARESPIQVFRGGR